MSQPLAFGLFDQDRQVYMLLTWIEGIDGTRWVSENTPLACYNLGVEAGRILAMMHTVKAPTNTESTRQQIQHLYETKIERYRNCGYRVDHDEDFIAYLEANFDILNDQDTGKGAQSFLHGDFHLANMVVSPNNKLSIIDFNRHIFGDPLRDFNRVSVFTRSFSVDFARGQVDGYNHNNNNNNQSLEQFFRRLSFYAALDSFFGVLWAIPHGPDAIQSSLKRAQLVWEDFKGFKSIVPLWYQCQQA
eukprot:gene3984-4614_t